MGSSYLFNAKESDEETGLYYYGVRYIDPTGAMWLSVDPLQEKYPGMNPYNYCAGNPVKFIDPDGREKIVVVGNEGDGPKEDFKSNGDYRYGKNKRFFLQAGIDRAKNINVNQKMNKLQC
ncbi:MAG: RHS repeat-associated core domain-containing protein [Paludibacteraceae bacterium]|nr:RHS repeat-associated core domain-containing protein [Paludibacteraceae bacterium]